VFAGRGGLIVDQKTKTIKIYSFVCDAPARSFIKGIKYPTGYSSCEKCTVHGEHDGKVIFPVTNCPLTRPLMRGLMRSITLIHVHLDPYILVLLVSLDWTACT
jgi:hypothetical protein